MTEKNTPPTQQAIVTRALLFVLGLMVLFILLSLGVNYATGKKGPAFDFGGAQQTGSAARMPVQSAPYTVLHLGRLPPEEIHLHKGQGAAGESLIVLIPKAAWGILTVAEVDSNGNTLTAPTGLLGRFFPSVEEDGADRRESITGAPIGPNDELYEHLRANQKSGVTYLLVLSAGKPVGMVKIVIH